MTTGRLEAFTDGVIAILITVMVLELREPDGTSWHALHTVLPTVFTYVLSFIYLGIYWNNHHHMLQATERVTGGVLWANLHLLFWLSLVPAATSWLGRNDFAEVPAAVYGMLLLAAAIAYYLLQTLIVRSQGDDSTLARAIGRDWKGKLSPALYISGVLLAFVQHWLAVAVYALVAAIWIIPDRRVEHLLNATAQDQPAG